MDTAGIRGWIRYAGTLMPRLAVVGVLLGVGVRANGAIVDWVGGDGSWYDTSNWSNNTVPDGFDIVSIGNLPGVQNSTVMLGAPGSGYDELWLGSGMTLDTDGGELVSFGPATITGNGTRLIVRPAAGLNGAGFIGELDLRFGASLELEDDATVRLENISKSNGEISGRGTININSYVPFVNNGVIAPSPNGGMVINQGPMNDAPIDLDGSLGDGELDLSTPYSALTVNASGLTDAFSGSIEMAPGSTLYMNIDGGWDAHFDSSITVEGGGNIGASQIAGDEMKFGGELRIGFDEVAQLRVLAPATINSTANTYVYDDSQLEFDGETVVEDANFFVHEGGNIDFDGPTTLHGGDFETFSNLSYQGAINFNGETTWAGNVVIDGVAHQFGDAAVNGLTNIHAGVFDMDGGGNTHWEINHIFQVHASSIESTLSNTFDGTFDLTNNPFSRLQIELDDPGAEWTMAGEMFVGGSNAQYPIRVAGSRIRVTGDLTFEGQRSRFTADAIFDNSSVITFALPETDVRMTGTTRIADGATFLGAGTLRNGETGHMYFEDGASLGNVRLFNEGAMEIAFGPGTASVGRFVSDDTASWSVDIGGYVAGSEFDVLIVSNGDAELAGILEVDLIDLGGGVFAPQIGDEFTVLTSLGIVTGTFANDPVTMIDGLTYEWSVLYGTHDVTLVLQNITPEPATLVLLAMGAVVVCRRRSK
ncbi:MAG: PEP-CTERM sorting domain-containing protein [Phycisphaerae bacterium]|nr:PEP-CTERM sorting domain-containing protein [Phycisphaerales bacterium]